MKPLFTVIFFTAISIVFIWLVFIFAKDSDNNIFETRLRTLHLGSAVITVAIADNQQTRRIGLSNFKSLPKNHGLLLMFRESDTHGVWMKDMRFPIDIIWMNEQLQVVDIHKNIHTETYPTSFHPKVPALFALEVEAGFSSKHNIKIGDKSSW